jgi:hypothetical protein
MGSRTSAAPWKSRREAICCLLTASLAFPAAGVARADMIAAGQVVNSTPGMSSDSLLARLKRPDVEYRLRTLGVDRKSAEVDVSAISDEEVRPVSRKLSSLYAVSQYIPPPLIGAGGVGGVAGVGGSYGYGGGAATLLGIGLVTFLNWRSVQTNASNPNYMTSNPAPMDPNRKISEQDCTKPIVFDGGNLRCK